MPMSNQESQGGFPVDYNKLRRRRRISPTDELDWHINSWIEERRAIILDVQESGHRVDSGKLDWLALDMAKRWMATHIGKSPIAWIERSVTFAAMLLDHRSRRFGRRVHTKKLNMEEFELGYTTGWSAFTDAGFQSFSPMEFKQALLSMIFATEWQRYLYDLLIRPPGEPPPIGCHFPTMYSEPDETVSNFVAQLAHCRPCGAFWELPSYDEWCRLGGRETCRNPLHCPHCHARNVTQLVNRVLLGPWNESRRSGRRLALIRLTVSTKELQLCRAELAADRADLGFDGWLRDSTDEYYADPGDDTKFRNISCNQSFAYTLTRVEIRAASNRLKQLKERCQRAGITGGICFHNIGPKKRNFQHELVVVGELSLNNNHFFDEFGRPETRSEDCQPVEYVLFSPGHKSSARLAIAGSSWKFNLDEVGATLNVAARRRCFTSLQQPRGLRGALAWQPLFLLAGNSFWSRWKAMRSMRFKGYQVFGNWKDLLASNRRHQADTQSFSGLLKKTDPLLTGQNRNPVYRLQQQIRRSQIHQTVLAQESGYSDAAVSQFVKHGFGSEALREALRQAMLRIAPEALGIGPKETLRFPSPQSVKDWLQAIGRNQSWLAFQLDWSRSKVTRLFNKQLKWSRDVSHAIASLAQRLEQ